MSPIIQSLSNASARGYGAFGGVATAADTGAMFPLQVITVGPAGASSVTFTNIPGTYSHLQIRAIGRSSQSANVNSSTGIRFNSDSGNNYATHILGGDGSSASAEAYTSQSYIFGNMLAASSAGSNIFGAVVIDILDYANTNKNKTIRILSGADVNGAGNVRLASGLWTSTSAITSITIDNRDGYSYQQYSQFALYAVKAAS